MTTDREPIERLVERALFAPLDLTIRVVHELPAIIERAERHLVLTRFVGRLAVDRCAAEVRRRLDSDARTAPTGATGDHRDEVPARDGTAGRRRSGATPARSRGDATTPQASELALPDYEHLPAAHVVAKLSGLRQSERDAIEAFETAHRHRRTILGKLEQLRDPA